MMKIEVWSDIMCPFCYIGKKNYEKALVQFAGAGDVEIEWKSFQLDPTIPQDESYPNEKQYLAERKGMSPAQVAGMLESVTATAAAAGVKMDFDKVIVANTLHAHRLLHFAKIKGLANAMKDRLFRAHFTDGLDVGKTDVLLKLAVEVGMDEIETRSVLESEDFAYEVAQDIQEAGNIGVRGVPFFVFNRKYAVSGAQPVEAFLQTLEKAHSEWKETQPKPAFEVLEGPSCSPETGCN